MAPARIEAISSSVAAEKIIPPEKARGANSDAGAKELVPAASNRTARVDSLRDVGLGVVFFISRVLWIGLVLMIAKAWLDAVSVSWQHYLSSGEQNQSSGEVERSWDLQPGESLTLTDPWYAISGVILKMVSESELSNLPGH